MYGWAAFASFCLSLRILGVVCADKHALTDDGGQAAALSLGLFLL